MMQVCLWFAGENGRRDFEKEKPIRKKGLYSLFGVGGDPRFDDVSGKRRGKSGSLYGSHEFRFPAAFGGDPIDDRSKGGGGEI